MFDTLAYTKKLEAVGLSRAHAETHVQMMADIIEKELATKQDLRDLESRLTNKILIITGSMTTVTVVILGFLIKA